MTRLSLRNPLLTPEQISESPSQRQGMLLELETDLRAYGVPQVVMASAQIMFQRFYYLAAFQDFSLRGTVLGTLFLACKVEENPQTIRNIINSLDIVISRDRGYPEVVADGYDAEFYDLKNEMVISEMQILRKLGFNVQVELPYGLLVNYLRSLELTEHPSVPQLAWNYLNDLLRTPVYVCFQPETIACGAIYLAAHESQVRLPESPPWWVIFDANGEDVAQVAKAIQAIQRKHAKEPVRHHPHLRSLTSMTALMPR
ncbi:cyclin-like protein [Kickxella alabastrina]|uniref:cyclin-like protein n=1 Tax=Kickxella alabastrina TaxID=61397 RepID=UPI0022205865|nr:cyclin-like protein [Kickxella alabastrina]KAI7823645.1 cyclin-like protein [Kickxella alabastrina]